MTMPSKLSSALPKTWRVVPLLQASGSVQMALDRWLLDQHCLGLAPPSLRFYLWSTPTLSLGYHQHRWPTHWEHLTWQGVPIELVRRPSGGRAVLHQGDLTYMVVTSGLTGSRGATYQAICEFLIQGWRSLGLELQYGQARRGYIHNPDCFGTATGADLVLPNGAKLIGSAQLRRGTALLQHGSMRLTPDAELFGQVFGGEFSGLPELPATLSPGTMIPVIMEALMAAARQCFGIEFIVQPLSETEWQQVLAQPPVNLQAAKP